MRLIDADALIGILHKHAFLEGDDRAIAYNIIEKQPTVNEWISVKDRPPEDNCPVMVAWINHNPPNYYAEIKGKTFVAPAVYFRGNWYWWDSTIEDRLSEYGRSDFGKFDAAIEVTHWQEMPAPPKRKG